MAPLYCAGAVCAGALSAGPLWAGGVWGGGCDAATAASMRHVRSTRAALCDRESMLTRPHIPHDDVVIT